MKRGAFIVGTAILVLATAIAFAAVRMQKNISADSTIISASARKPIIATTILPLTITMKNIVGDRADVRSIVPSGSSPHEFAFTPAQIALVHEADVVVKLGLHLDDWVDAAIESAPEKPSVIIASDALELPENSDPHVWLSPRMMTEIISWIPGKLGSLFPEIAEDLQKNGWVYYDHVYKLRYRLVAMCDNLQANVVSFHNAFSYLADECGFKVLDVIEETPGASPSPKDVARIVQKLRDYPKAALIGETGIDPAILSVIAEDTGRIVYEINPMETGDANEDAYIRVMNKNFDMLSRAFGLK